MADFLAPGATAVVALLLMRLTGLMLIAPVFSARAVPGRIRIAALMAFTLALLPAVLPLAGGEVRVTAVTLFSETLIGVTLGLGAAIFVAAAESAGDMLAVQMGLSGANILDPLSHTQMPILGQLMGLTVTAMILAVGGHRLMLEAMALSFESIPPGGPIAFEEGIVGVVGLGGYQLVLGLRFAAPVIAAMMVGNAALGVLAKTVPQLNVLMVAFPVQIGIGLLVLAVTLPLVASFFSGWPVTYGGIVEDLLGTLSPRAGG